VTPLARTIFIEFCLTSSVMSIAGISYLIEGITRLRVLNLKGWIKYWVLIPKLYVNFKHEIKHVTCSSCVLEGRRVQKKNKCLKYCNMTQTYFDTQKYDFTSCTVCTVVFKFGYTLNITFLRNVEGCKQIC